VSSGDELFNWILGGILFAGLLVVAAWVGVQNWRECRATPHTVLYCLTRGG